MKFFDILNEISQNLRNLPILSILLAQREHHDEILHQALDEYQSRTFHSRFEAH